jgi:dimethylargininase
MVTDKRFRYAIVKTPGKSMVDGLTTANLGIPDYKKAVQQHVAYTEALKKAGVQVRILPPSEEYPDSTFIEDTTLLIPDCAIITNPGAPSRQGEILGIKPILDEYFKDIIVIKPPGTVDGGDILTVGTHYYIGLSKRTNENGANQIIEILNHYHFTGSIIRLENMLHLKTGVAYIENDNLVACGELLQHPAFQKFNRIKISDDERYAANCVWINGLVFIPRGFPKAKKSIEMVGYETLELDVSEFQKLDGGLSCLSLRF